MKTKERSKKIYTQSVGSVKSNVPPSMTLVMVYTTRVARAKHVNAQMTNNTANFIPSLYILGVPQEKKRGVLSTPRCWIQKKQKIEISPQKGKKWRTKP
jgi:hypothetical protein